MNGFGNKLAKDDVNILQQRWSPEEDELVMVTVAQFQRTGKPRRAYWDKVAKTVNRSEQSVRSRYFALKKRGKFADVEQDEFLCTGFLPNVCETGNDDPMVGKDDLNFGKAWSEFEQ